MASRIAAGASRRLVLQVLGVVLAGELAGGCGVTEGNDAPRASGPSGPTTSSAPPPLAIALVLRSGPDSISVDVTVTATGRNPVEPALFASVLEVDGKPWPSWSLIVGNGTIDESSLRLLPGHTTTLQRLVSPSAFPRGDHVAVLHTAGVSSPPTAFRTG